MTVHRRAVRLSQGLGALLLVLLSTLSAGAVRAAAAPGVPSDPSANGFIGLCDRNGKNVTSGTLGATPFVWKAVASTSPPAQYLGRGQNAVLNVFQPRPQIPAAEWSGDQLTASTLFTTKSAPSVQATNKDLPLSVIVREYPPLVNGLYELRMYFGRLNYGLYNSTYPATFIRVSGDRWSVVQGGTVNCSASSGQSTEVLSGALSPRMAYGSATPQPPTGRPANKPLVAGDAAGSARSESPVADTTGTTGPNGSQLGAQHGGSSTAVAWWIAAAAVVAAAGAAFAWIRARRRNA